VNYVYFKMHGATIKIVVFILL